MIVKRASRLHPASPEFLAELRAKYPRGQSSPSMRAAVARSAARAESGALFVEYEREAKPEEASMYIECPECGREAHLRLDGTLTREQWIAKFAPTTEPGQTPKMRCPGCIQKGGRAALLERRAAIVRERQSMIDDVAHWNSIHPNEEPLDAGVEELDAMLADFDRKMGIQ